MIFVWICEILLIHSWTDRHLCYFHILLLNNPAVSFSEQVVFVVGGGVVLVNIRFHFSWGLYLGVEFLDTLVWWFVCRWLVGCSSLLVLGVIVRYFTINNVVKTHCVLKRPSQLSSTMPRNLSLCVFLCHLTKVYFLIYIASYSVCRYLCIVNLIWSSQQPHFLKCFKLYLKE